MNERASRTERLLSFNKNANIFLQESRFSDRPSLTRFSVEPKLTLSGVLVY